MNILIKNMLDVFIGGGSYWALGWGLAYGAEGNPFSGGSQFFNYQLPYDQYPKWFFQVMKKVLRPAKIASKNIKLSQMMVIFFRRD